MIDLEKAKKEFINYTKQFDLEDTNIQRKIGHSLRVMEISGQLAKALSLKKEEIDLATLIGLLHDIGRFEQRTKYKTFRDHNSIDHGELGVNILKEKDYIRRFYDDSKKDTIIFKAIINHNKYKLEEKLTPEEELFCKIIRDSDKIDILYEGVEIFWKNEEQQKSIENAIITREVLEQWNENIPIQNEIKSNGLDYIIGMLSFIFDLNFKASYQIIYKNDYINKILNRFDWKEETTRQEIAIIRQFINKYIEKQI